MENINQTKKENLVLRQPIVVVMGHVDNGKTTLLDYIRKTSVAEKESGGITQHIGAYEAALTDKKGDQRKITFVDTPGHEAFSKMRARGARVADVAILVIAAEEGLKPQTKEALEAIKTAGIPFIIALNKIDKPSSNPDKVKKELGDANVIIEEWGGKTPLVPISAKTGEGVEDLLEMILILSDLEDLKADPSARASGLVVESHLDSKRGNTATLIIQNGTLKKGDFVVCGRSFATVRIFEDFAGHSIEEAIFGQPVRVVGFNEPPEVGLTFGAVKTKKEAEVIAQKAKAAASAAAKTNGETVEKKFTIPVIIKADVAGSAEALENEIRKLESERLTINILKKTVGPITEDDVKMASGAANTLIIGFRVSVEKTAAGLAERYGIGIKTFEIIYEVADWLKEELTNRLPEEIIEKEIGKAKILKIFKQGAKDQIIGGRGTSGFIANGKKFIIKRRGNPIGDGRIQELEQGKSKTSQVEESKEFGARINSKTAMAEGDEIEAVDEEKIKAQI